METLNHVWLFATPWTVAYQAPLSMEFSRQEYWNGLPFPSPGDLPDPGIEPGSPALQANALLSEPPTREEIEKVILKAPWKQTLASDGTTIKFKLLKNFFIFNWRRIALQYCIGFCHTSTWISYWYLCVTSLPSPIHSTHLGWQRAPVWAPWVIDKFPLAIYFTYWNVHASKLLSQFVTPSPFPTVSTGLFSMSTPPLLPCKEVHQYHLSRVYIYVLIYNICFSLLTYFTLYNRL